MDNTLLVRLRKYTQDIIPDIATYTISAFTKYLAQLSRDN